MFGTPLHRDPLVVCWTVVMALATAVALIDNNEWSGTLQPDLVAGFLKDVADAFLWSFLLLLLLAWLRARGWRRNRPRSQRSGRGESKAVRAEPRTSGPLPWTGSWLGPHRAAEDQPRPDGPHQPVRDDLPIRCRHGVPTDAHRTAGHSPILRALSTSSTVVPPGSDVSVTWCFEAAADVSVDGRRGHPSCGEATVRIDRSRRVELVGRNRRGASGASTAEIVAVVVPTFSAAAVVPPPPVSLRADVSAPALPSSSVTQRLDAFWTVQDGLSPRLQAAPRFVGVPASTIRALRRSAAKKESR